MSKQSKLHASPTHYLFMLKKIHSCITDEKMLFCHGCQSQVCKWRYWGSCGIVHWVSETCLLIFMYIINVLLILQPTFLLLVCVQLVSVSRGTVCHLLGNKTAYRFRGSYLFPSEILISYQHKFFLEQLEGFSKHNWAINRKVKKCPYLTVLHLLMKFKCYLVLNIEIHWCYIPFFRLHITLELIK